MLFSVFQVVNMQCWNSKFCFQPFYGTIASIPIWKRKISNYKLILYWSVKKVSKCDLNDESRWPRLEPVAMPRQLYTFQPKQLISTNFISKIQFSFWTVFSFLVSDFNQTNFSNPNNNHTYNDNIWQMFSLRFRLGHFVMQCAHARTNQQSFISFK